MSESCGWVKCSGLNRNELMRHRCRDRIYRKYKEHFYPENLCRTRKNIRGSHERPGISKAAEGSIIFSFCLHFVLGFMWHERFSVFVSRSSSHAAFVPFQSQKVQTADCTIQTCCYFLFPATGLHFVWTKYSCEQRSPRLCIQIEENVSRTELLLNNDH